jgi:hypothetical protein
LDQVSSGHTKNQSWLAKARNGFAEQFLDKILVCHVPREDQTSFGRSTEQRGFVERIGAPGGEHDIPASLGQGDCTFAADACT